MNITPVSLNRNQTAQNSNRQNPNFGMKIAPSNNLKTKLIEMFTDTTALANEHAPFPRLARDVANAVDIAQAEHNATPLNHVISDEGLFITNIYPVVKDEKQSNFSRLLTEVPDELEVWAMPADKSCASMISTIISIPTDKKAARKFSLTAAIKDAFKRLQDTALLQRDKSEFASSIEN